MKNEKTTKGVSALPDTQVPGHCFGRGYGEVPKPVRKSRTGKHGRKMKIRRQRELEKLRGKRRK